MKLIFCFREMKIKRLKGSSKFVQKTSENEKPNASKKSKSRNSSPPKKEKESKKTPNEFGQGNKKPASRNSSVDKVTKHKNVKKKKIKK